MATKPPKIIPLPPETISQIAAGEVIDRPASVIKELIENALDAEATEITIELENGGLDLIRVTDNGHGMERHQLQQSTVWHMTSKLEAVQDLNHIFTMGFRGEAMAAIAESGQLEIFSRPAANPLGARYAIGEKRQAEPFGMPAGTIVTVRDLFAHLPARKKFLKTPQAEWQHCLRLITNLALINFKVGWRVISNQKLMLHLRPVSSLVERANQLLPEDLLDQMQSFRQESEHVVVNGLLSDPAAAQKHSTHQYWFINDRLVKHPQLAQAVKTAYRHRIHQRSFPPVVISVELPPGMIDPNVHPQKKTVGLTSGANILPLINQAVASAFGAPPTKQYLPDLPPSKAKTHLQNRLKKIVKHWQTLQDSDQPPAIFQANDVFIVTPTDQGLLIVDQHAAHERILYEQYLAKLTAKERKSKKLAQPIKLPKFTFEEIAAFTFAAKTFKKTGFSFEKIDNQPTTITHIPDWFDAEHALEIVLDTVQATLADEPVAEVDDASQRTVAYLACRTAVKAGDKLSVTQQQNLLEKLYQTPRHQTCPHGRPTTIQISWKELLKLFKR